MPRQLFIDDHIEFRGDALHRSNVDGPMQETKVHFHDHFTDDTLSTDKWATTLPGSTDAIAVEHTTYPGGICRITTGTVDDDSCWMETAASWEDDMYAVCEARVLLADVSGTAFYFGFSDSACTSNGDMPIDYEGGTLANSDTNAVGIICDAEDTVNGASSIVAVGVNAGTLETAIDSATDWADGKWHALRIELDPDGDATFYLDGVSFGHMTTAITSGTHMCISCAAATRANDGANYVYIDRVDAWQNEC